MSAGTTGRQTSSICWEPPTSGVVRRTTARAEDGEWLVVVVWRSGSDADAAAARFGDDPGTSAFREMVDASTARTRRYRTLD